MTSRSEVTPWWRNRRYLPWLVQGVVALLVVVVVAFLFTNLLLNLTSGACCSAGAGWGSQQDLIWLKLSCRLMPAFPTGAPCWQGWSTPCGW